MLRKPHHARALGQEFGIPIEQAPERRLDLSNVQALWSVCHSRKTLRESVVR
jgi:hypothetical protein